MASFYDLKPRFQRWLRPLVAWCAANHLSANRVTLLACALSLVMAALLACFPERSVLFLCLLPVLVLRMALNAIDGMLARDHGQASKLGGVLNEICDVISDLALTLAFVPLALFWGTSIWPIVALALAGLFNEFCGVLGHGLGAGRRYEGPGGKSDRAFLLGIAALLAFGLDVFHWPLASLSGVFGVATALALWSSFSRLRAILNHESQEGTTI